MKITVLIRHALLFALVLAVAAPCGTTSGTTIAQQDEEVHEATEPRQLLKDFIFYTNIARPELASASAEMLLNSGMTDAELAEALDELGNREVERFDEAAIRAQKMPALSDIAAELAKRLEEGRLDLARDPERIEEAVRMLSGTRRAQMLAEDRLDAAGEYAVPYLLRTIATTNDESLKNSSLQVLVLIGREAVTPLCIALPVLDEFNQRLICNALGDIGYDHAAPYLKALAQDPQAADFVRNAADRAFRRLEVPDAELTYLFSNLAQRYFQESRALIGYPDEPTNNIWTTDPTLIVTATPVPTEIYSEIMAMGTSSQSLTINPNNQSALSTFVASNLKRENELPAEETDPIYGDLDYTPMFFATVFGTQTAQNVLAMGLDAGNTPLIRDAIEALSRTTGGVNLFSIDGQRQPLVEALQYSDRRTQYEAALVLGNALPSQSFNGDYAVVPTLASAVRTSGRNFAAILADSQEEIRTDTALLEELGYEVVAAGRSLQELRPQVEDAIAVDLVLISMPTADRTRDAVRDIRRIGKAAASPVLILADAAQMAAMRFELAQRNRLQMVRADASQNAVEAAMNELLQRAVGGAMDEADAIEYAIKSLTTLRDIAIADNTVYNIADAEPALVDAIGTQFGPTRMLVADVLAMIDSERSQHTLFDAALAASDGEQTQLLERVADSVKRHGSYAERRHQAGLLNLIRTSSGDTAEAAARVYGAMNLSASEAVELVPSHK